MHLWERPGARLLRCLILARSLSWSVRGVSLGFLVLARVVFFVFVLTARFLGRLDLVVVGLGRDGREDVALVVVFLPGFVAALVAKRRRDAKSASLEAREATTRR